MLPDQPQQPGRVRLPRFDPEAFGRWSEGTARYMGTANFIVAMTVVISAWLLWNTLAPASMRFDPYTFTFLTLMLSLQASYAAPLILLAQNRQTDRDRLAMEEDRRRAAMQKADSTNPDKYLPELAKINYDGITGNIAFDERGDMKKAALTLYTFKGGKKTQMMVVQ